MNLPVIALLSAVLLNACASHTAADVARDQARADAIRAEQEDARVKAENKKLKRALKAVPKWAVEPPQSDATGVFALGMGHDNDLRRALSKARLQAEFGLAKQFGQAISGSERAYDADGRNGLQYTALIDKIVDHVPVVGFETVKSEVTVNAAQYHAYLLLRLPHHEFNRVLQDLRAGTHDSTVKAAFDDLERRLADYRARHAG